MTSAQEAEIHLLYKRLESAEARVAAAEARADGLQASLFEASLQTRRAVEACKRDAVAVAVEEAVVSPSHVSHESPPHP